VRGVKLPLKENCRSRPAVLTQGENKEQMKLHPNRMDGSLICMGALFIITAIVLSAILIPHQLSFVTAAASVGWLCVLGYGWLSTSSTSNERAAGEKELKQ
jgi:hypothetical protein